jgi:E3 ubiquitin-protein ligase UHRF1
MASPAPVGAAAAGAQQQEDPSSPKPDPAQDAMRAKMRAIMAINNDATLSDEEKSRRRQEVMMGKWAGPPAGGKENRAGEFFLFVVVFQTDAPPTRRRSFPLAPRRAHLSLSLSPFQPPPPTTTTDGTSKADPAADGDKTNKSTAPTSLAVLDDALKCTICFDLCERPVTAPCQHNYCLACFKSWAAKTAAKARCCPTCRAPVPAKFVDNPRINTALTAAIRLAKQGAADAAAGAARAATVMRVPDRDRPDDAFTTERAVRAGRANAASGRLMVTCPGDHFGPIGPEFDPERQRGVAVGEWWRDRLHCRQWGAHFPHVAGIAGQSGVGAQSVVLSGGYEDDRDEGEWFLYTGSGGRDLSGNKRTSKVQSHDQEFTNMNEALRMSCVRGLPVRVVRSYKEKRSAYAPPEEMPVRYDGCYRILRCWRKKGAQGKLVCRYLFVRADNEPAPWIAGEDGDGPPEATLPREAEQEMKGAHAGKVYSMDEGSQPFWDWLPSEKKWGWAKPAPPSGKAGSAEAEAGGEAKRLRKQASAHEKLLRDFGCGICKKLMQGPVSTPCGHNFCHSCLDGRYAAAELAAAQQAAKAAAIRDRPTRARRVPKPCPSCKADLCDFLGAGGAQVNREMEALIARLREAADKARKEADEVQAAGGGGAAGAGGAGGSGEGDEEAEEEGGSGSGAGEEEAAAPKVDEAAAAEPPKAEEPPKEEAAKEEAAKEEPSDDAAPDAKAAAGGAAAAAPSAAAGRYASELAQLRAAFPDFDEGLMLGMLEDQGGDLEEVRAYLRRIKNQLAHGARQQAKQQQQQQGAAGAAAGEGAAAASPAAKAAAASPAPAEAAAGGAPPPPSTAGKKKRGRPSKKDKEAAAAAAAAGAEPLAAPAAKRAATAAAGGEAAEDVGAAADKAMAA